MTRRQYRKLKNTAGNIGFVAMCGVCLAMMISKPVPAAEITKTPEVSADYTIQQHHEQASEASALDSFLVDEYGGLEYAGNFTVTAYCSCSKCCGKWSGSPTASGTYPVAGRTVAVDPNKIPYGTVLVIDGHEYVAEDCGSGVNGNWIDLFMDSHSEALSWGLQKKEVYIKK